MDANGNVWAGNRSESTGGKGSVIQVGLEENGQCVDRNANTVIDTSTGLGDIKPWLNGGGVDNNGGVTTADDECIIKYVRVAGNNVRHVSVDGNNNVWTGGHFGGDNSFDLVSQATGAILASFDVGCGGYGGLVDGAGVLWSASRTPTGLLRYDTNNTNGTGDDSWSCLNAPNSYGLGIDSSGNIWHSQFTNNTILKFNPAGTLFGGCPKTTGGASGDRGVAVTQTDDNVWVANSSGSDVSRLNNAGTVVAVINLDAAAHTVGLHAHNPTGVSVDAVGKVWATNLGSSTASRINPASNTVDLTVNLGAGAGPYNYSDMTGSTVIAVPDNGTWIIVYDSGGAGTNWGFVTWNDEPQGATPGDSALDLTARTSPDGLAPWSAPEIVAYGADLTVPDNRFVEVRVKFTRATAGTDTSPVLSDLTIKTAGGGPLGDKNVSDIECNLSAGPDGTPNQHLAVTITNAYPSIDYFCDIEIHGTGSVPVHITNVTLDDGTSPSPLPVGTTLQLENCHFVPNGTTPPGTPLADPSNPVGEQLHFSDRVICTLHVHLENNAQQLAVYTFSGSVTSAQYNEA